MNETLIRKHNAVVGEKDLVIHLGDFCWGTTGRAREVLVQLNGDHVLIVGNHDKMGIIAACNAGFIFACTEMQMHIGGHKVLLKHYPYRPSLWQRLFRIKMELRYMDRRPVDQGDWLLHGHTHSKCKGWNKQINVGVDAWDFRPVPITAIEKILGGKNNPNTNNMTKEQGRKK